MDNVAQFPIGIIYRLAQPSLGINTLSFSPSHNPIQNMYVRVATGNQNVMTDIIVKGLADPSTDCKS